MARITYIEHGGQTHELDIAIGRSVMQGATDNVVRGIIGECGGCLSCATCHVYVDPVWFDQLNEKSEVEKVLLEEVCDVQTNSRLSCQIIVSDELDGLLVRLPEKQV